MKIIRFLAVLIILALLGGYWGLTYLQSQLPQEAQLINIPAGSTPQKIADILTEKKVIVTPWQFRIKVKLMNAEHKLQAGLYSFSAADDIGIIIEKLAEGKVAVYDDIRVTIPEGRKITVIAELLESKNVISSAEDFLEAVNEYLPDYPYLPQSQGKMLFRLEGYLFPDTYDFFLQSEPKAVIDKLIKRFDQQIYKLYEESNYQGKLSFHELLTLASIVEKEAVLGEERATIAGVFYNRLKINQALESCATVQYVLKEHKEVLLFEDLKIESPFNTYKYASLPPGPISSVGQASFKAVLEPEKHDYLYFHAIGGGKHHFSKTFAEHQASIAKHRK